MSQSDSGNDFERIRPAAINRASAAARAASPAKNSLSTAGVLAALVLVLVLSGGLFLWLYQAPQQPPAQTQAAPKPPGNAKADAGADAKADATAPAAGAVPDADALLARRAEAQELAQTLDAKRASLQAKAGTRWAAGDYADTGSLAERSAAAFAKRDYRGAITAAEAGIAIAEDLLARAEAVLADALARGQTGLKEHDAAAAAAAFDLALAIAPDNAAAKAGAARAASLDEVLALMAQGEHHEQAGDLNAAAAAYGEAKELDPAFAAAGEAVARVRQALAAQRFNAKMSTGLTALAQQDFAAAERAFIAALAIRAGAAEAADGLAQARAGLQRQAIARWRGKAEAAAQAEDWPAAVAAYEQVLALDPTLAQAQAALDVAKTRAQLARRLAQQLQQPERLQAPAVRTEAAALLERARTVASPGPVLQGRIAELARRLQTASQPVPVRLVSNGRAEVLVYQVGNLGRFEVKQLELTPGDYTAIGRCAGHRDARLNFTVTAGGLAAPVTIGCGAPL